MPLELQVLNALAKRLGEVDVIAHTLRDVKVIAGNTGVDQIAGRFPGLVFPEIARRMFQRVLQLLAGQFQSHERVFIFVKAGDVAHGDRPL